MFDESGTDQKVSLPAFDLRDSCQKRRPVDGSNNPTLAEYLLVRIIEGQNVPTTALTKISAFVKIFD